MYRSVSNKHQIGDHQVHEPISRTINLTNIISILVHYCIKTYFQPWSHSSPTPFLMKRKSCRFNIGLASISVSLYTLSRHTPSRHTPSPKMYRFNFGNPRKGGAEEKELKRVPLGLTFWFTRLGSMRGLEMLCALQYALSTQCAALACVP